MTKAGTEKAGGELTPLLVDSTEGARILGISLSTFYKFTRKNESTPMLQLGTLQRWRKNDLLRLMGKTFAITIAEDFLIDVKTAAMLCAVSRPMFYKMNQSGMTPEPIFDGRTLRWSAEVIMEWIGAGCPRRRVKKGERK